MSPANQSRDDTELPSCHLGLLPGC